MTHAVDKVEAYAAPSWQVFSPEAGHDHRKGVGDLLGRQCEAPPRMPAFRERIPARKQYGEEKNIPTII